MFRIKTVKTSPPPLFGDISAADDPGIEIIEPRNQEQTHFWSEARLLARDLIFALMFAVLLVVFVVQPVKVEGTSMLSRLHDGERIFVNKLVYYGLPELKRGDIVVFWYPNDPSKSYIKRVIGLPRETVEIREGKILINGHPLDEPYLESDLNQNHPTKAPLEVKDHYYFVMGDNRDNSSDSRSWGLVPEKYIYGKALFRYWPLSEASVVSHTPLYNLPATDMSKPPRNSEDEDADN